MCKVECWLYLIAYDACLESIISSNQVIAFLSGNIEYMAQAWLFTRSLKDLASGLRVCMKICAKFNILYNKKNMFWMRFKSEFGICLHEL
jgi:hypothetical protein